MPNHAAMAPTEQNALMKVAAPGENLCKRFCSALNAEFGNGDDGTTRRSLLNLGTSGDRGCAKCQLLYEVCIGLYPILKENTANILVEISSFSIWVQCLLSSIRDSEIYPPIYLYYNYNMPPPDWIPLFPHRKNIVCRRDQFQELILDWLDDCEKNHDSCQMYDQPLPTRVIHVGDDKGKEPFLHLSKGEKGRYAALSHCWGGEVPLKTKKCNLLEHQRCIPFGVLPKNFQHAITVARAIGINYVWIDSLCILQDDGQDWEIESSRMASCYQNAHVVLIASNSSDSQGGLWDKSWDDYGQMSRMKEFQYMNSSGSMSQIIALTELSHEDDIPESYLEYAAPSPISKRAWTLQEQLLGSRCIFFTGKELLWKCHGAQKCECMQEDNEDKFAQRRRKSLWESATSPDSSKRFGDWRSLMAYYSKRQITYESDRLPAISGMAHHMQSKGAGEYLAGMWKDDIWEGLLWLPRPVWPQITNDNLTSTYRKRTSTYQAPTWSWFSLETYGDGSDKPQCPGLVDWQEGRYWYLQRSHAKIIDAYCEPAGIDSTGAVKGGYIILQSKCIEAWLTWQSRNSQVLFGKVPLSVQWDIDLEFDLRQKVYLFLIGDAIDDEESLRRQPVRGLVLRRSKTIAGTFERVGLFDVNSLLGNNRNIFEEAKEFTLTII